LHLYIDKRLQHILQHAQRMRRTLQDLVREQAAFTRKVARHLDLAPYVGAQLRQRIAGRVEIAQRLQPVVQQPLDKLLMDGFLAAEIIEQIGPRHVRRLGDLVDGRPAKAIRRKDVKRRFKYSGAPLGLYARSRMRRLRRAQAPPSPGFASLTRKSDPSYAAVPSSASGGQFPLHRLSQPGGALSTWLVVRPPMQE